MRLTFTFFALLIIIQCSTAFAQQNNVWYFGNGTGIDFNGPVPNVLTDGSMGLSPTGQPYSYEGCASIADRTTGRLLFYTDGVSVWNRNHILMPNGTGLKGHLSSTQSALIVPVPGDPLSYYVFTTDASESLLPQGLNYSIVDLRANNGLGDVVVKNVHLIDSTSEKLCGVLRCDGTGYWILCRRRETERYYALSVTSAGVAPPVISQILPDPKDPAEYLHGAGYLVVSRDGRKVASANTAEDQIRILDFNITTGRLSLSTTLSTGTTSLPYGLCFSPDNSRLYTSLSQHVIGGVIQPRGLYQYDVTRDDPSTIEASRVFIQASRGVMIYALAMGPNNRIYGAVVGSVLAEVAQPNASGDACQFKMPGLDLGSGYCRVGLPNQVSGSIPAVSAGNDTTICQGGSVQLHGTGTGAIQYRWSPAQGLSCTDCPNPVASPMITTVYYLEATSLSDCTINSAIKAVDSVQVTVIAAPKAEAGRDTAVCIGAEVQLHASGAGRYSWSPETDLSCIDCPNPTVRPSVTTTYYVTVTNAPGCSSTDSVTVTVFNAQTIDIGADTAICQGGEVHLQGTSGDSWTWFPTLGLDCSDCQNPIARPTQTMTYHLAVVSAGGCTGTDSITITVNDPPMIVVSKDTSVCTGSAVQLHASGGTDYQWSPGDGLSCTNCADPVAIPAQTTTYRVIATNASGCESTDSVTIVVLTKPVADAGQSQNVCAGQSVQLAASAATSWIWSPPSGLSCTDCQRPVASPAQTTTYTVTVTNASGCMDSDTVSVTVLPVPVIDAGADVSLCTGEAVQLHATGAASYRWSPSDGLSCSDCADPVATPGTSIVYMVVGTTADGCSGTDEVKVTVETRKVQARMDRSYVVFPGGSVLVPVVLDEPVGGDIDTLEFTSTYNRGILRLREVLTGTGALNGWRREVITDSIGGIHVRFVASGGGRPIGAGELLTLRFDGYLGDTVGSELPFTVELPNKECVSVKTTAGLIMLDSVCGLSYRLMESSSAKYALGQNEPNPFNPTTRINFSIPFDAFVRLTVVDVSGKRVATLVDGTLQAGAYEVEWDAQDASSGLYYYRLETDGRSISRAMMLVR